MTLPTSAPASLTERVFGIAAKLSSAKRALPIQLFTDEDVIMSFPFQFTKAFFLDLSK